MYIEDVLFYVLHEDEEEAEDKGDREKSWSKCDEVINHFESYYSP